jgi:hypothetical protein
MSTHQQGQGYTPELNVELPVATLFDGLGRTPEFYTRTKNFYGELEKTYSNAIPRKPIGSLQEKSANTIADSTKCLRF